MCCQQKFSFRLIAPICTETLAVCSTHTAARCKHYCRTGRSTCSESRRKEILTETSLVLESAPLERRDTWSRDKTSTLLMSDGWIPTHAAQERVMSHVVFILEDVLCFYWRSNKPSSALVTELVWAVGIRSVIKI